MRIKGCVGWVGFFFFNFLHKISPNALDVKFRTVNNQAGDSITAKYLTVSSTSLCAFLRYNQYLGVPVASALVIPRAWIPWVTPAKPMGVVLNLRSWASNRQP